MSRQIAFGYQEPPIEAVEERVQRLEARVGELTSALQALLEALDETQPALAAAARRLRELFPDQPAAGGRPGS